MVYIKPLLFLTLIKMEENNNNPLNIFAEEIFEGTDPGKQISSMVLKSSRGLKERLKGPFTLNEAKQQVTEFRQRTRSGIAEIELSFIE